MKEQDIKGGTRNALPGMGVAVGEEMVVLPGRGSGRLIDR